MADFFDKLKDGVNKSVATVSTGSKTIIEKSKINSVIKTLADEKKQLLEILGNKVYLYVKENGTDVPLSEIESICSQISSRIEQINEQNQKLEELDDEMNKITGTTNITAGMCSCGNVNKPGAKFCVSCGKKLI